MYTSLQEIFLREIDYKNGKYLGRIHNKNIKEQESISGAVVIWKTEEGKQMRKAYVCNRSLSQKNITDFKWYLVEANLENNTNNIIFEISYHEMDSFHK